MTTPSATDAPRGDALGVFIRIALAVIFLDELVVGGWNAIWPAGFYRHFPTVDLAPPFSEHFARDFGGATLGIAVLLGIALCVPRSSFTLPAAIAFSIFAVPHFLFHLIHRDGAGAGEYAALTLANAVVALLGVGVVIADVVREQRGNIVTPGREDTAEEGSGDE